jgi:hypothetical protein
VSGSDWVNVILSGVGTLIILVVALRAGHYARTGRWFR